MSPLLPRRALLGVTLGVLLALALAPQTRWLVRYQSLSVLRLGPLPGYCAPASDTGLREAARLRAVAAAHPADFPVQYAATPWGDNAAPLRNLETRFPDNASLRANVLRQMTRTETLSFQDRTEVYRLEQKPLPRSEQETGPPDPDRVLQLAAFDENAAAGERLDPDNAYFPLMRAIGLYAARRDAEARAAVLRAGTESGWSEYYDDEIDGQVRLHALAFGDRSALWHAAVAAAVLLPQYARLRQVAWLATYQAMQDEQAGHTEDGLALRHALLHCGSLMRTQSPLLIGALVGAAIAQTAMQRPGGIPWVEAQRVPRNNIDDFYPPTVARAYADFLRRHGEAQAAQQVISEDQADQEVFAVTQRVSLYDTELSGGSPYGRSMRRLFLAWIAGLLLLGNAFSLLLLGGSARLSGRIPPLRLHRRWVRLSLRIAGALLGLGLVVGLARGMTQGVQALIAFGMAFPASWFAAPFLPNLVPLVAVIVPALICLAGLWRRRRVPMSRTILAGAIPAACATLLLYAGVVLTTVRQERVVNTALTQSLSGEGHYFAQRLGLPWPGVVD